MFANKKSPGKVYQYQLSSNVILQVITHVFLIIVYIFFNIQKQIMKPLNILTNSQSKKFLFLLELQNPFYLYGVLSVSIQDIFPRLVRVVHRVIKSVDLTQTKH